MTKIFVLFWGWTKDDDSHRSFINTASSDYQFYVINYEQFVPTGDLNLLSDKIAIYFENNNIQKANIIGHSLGGALALLFAKKYPQKVKQLYLLDSSGIYGNENIFQLIKNFFITHNLHGKRKAKEHLKLFYRILKNPFFYPKLAKFGYLANLEREAKSIKIPTTLIWAENDHINPLWQGKKLNHLIKNSKLVVLKNEDHDWVITAPEKFWQNV